MVVAQVRDVVRWQTLTSTCDIHPTRLHFRSFFLPSLLTFTRATRPQRLSWPVCIVNTSLSFPVELISPRGLRVTSQQFSSATAIAMSPRPPHPSRTANATSLRRAHWTQKWSRYNLRGPLSIRLTGWSSAWPKTVRFLFRNGFLMTLRQARRRKKAPPSQTNTRVPSGTILPSAHPAPLWMYSLQEHQIPQHQSLACSKP